MTVRILLPLLAIVRRRGIHPGQPRGVFGHPGPGQGGGPQNRQGIPAQTSRGHRRSHPGSAGQAGIAAGRTASAPRSADKAFAVPTRCRRSRATRRAMSPSSSSSTTSAAIANSPLKSVRDLLEDRQAAAHRLEGVFPSSVRSRGSRPGWRWPPRSRAGTSNSHVCRHGLAREADGRQGHGHCRQRRSSTSNAFAATWRIPPSRTTSTKRSAWPGSSASAGLLRS